MEASTVSDDSENRLTVGGKRKSSGRRSSILKAVKSPLKSGALEDLDPNSLDIDTRSQSKKSRRSSGRRVSFAEKNEIKEFFVEDWQSAWKKEIEKSNLKMSGNPSQSSEYREPAKSITGLDTLLKGDIQEDCSQLCKVEIQKMPEVQFNQINETENEMISYDMGVLLQTVTQDQVQSPDPLDITSCHGGIVDANSNFNPQQQIGEMEYTRCHNTELGSQTRVFSGDGDGDGDGDVELDITCTKQEIFFRDYPNAPLSSPTNPEESAKMDCKSFLLSLKSKPSSFQGNTITLSNLEESTKMDSKSFLASLSSQRNEISSCDIRCSSQRQPLGEITDRMSYTARVQDIGWDRTKEEESKFVTDVELTTCHNFGVLDKGLQRAKRRSIYDSVGMDVTACFGPGLTKSSDKPSACGIVSHLSHHLGATVQCMSESNGVQACYPVGNQTADDHEEKHPDELGDLDMTSCYGSGIIPGTQSSVADTETTERETQNTDSLDFTVCHGHSVFSKFQDSTSHSSLNIFDDMAGKMDIAAAHGSAVSQSTETGIKFNIPKNSFAVEEQTKEPYESADHLDITNCYGSGILLNGQSSATGPDETVLFAAKSGSLDLTVCREQDVFSTFPSSSLQAKQGELPSDCSYRVDSSAFLKSLSEGRSTIEKNSEDLDDKLKSSPVKEAVTNSSCSITPNKESLARTQTEDWVSNIGSVECQQNDEEDLELTSCHSFKVIDSSLKESKRRSIYEVVDIDVTSCYGPGLRKLPAKQVPGTLNETLNVTRRMGEFRLFDNIAVNRAEGVAREEIQQQPNETKLPLTTHCSQVNIDNDVEKMQSVHEAKIQSPLTSDKGRSGKIGSKYFLPSLTSRASSFQGSDIFSTSVIGKAASTRQSFGDATVVKSPTAIYPGDDWNGVQPQKEAGFDDDDDDVEMTACHSFKHQDSSPQKAKRKSIYEPSGMDVTICFGGSMLKSPFNQVTHDSVDATLNLTRSEKAVAESCDPEMVSLSDEEVVREFDPRKLSIIEEVDDGIKTEVEESQNFTQRPITLKEFLDITEIVFITEVNTRRSIAPSIAINSTQTPKDKIVASLVSAPKVACYEEAIPVIEAEIAEMKKKVKQQEMELNASNPQVFLEAQSATKQELSVMRTDARRLRSACDKTATREWKQRKNLLNKTVLSKLMENRQCLADDVNIVEESLGMVDDCFKLLDKMDGDLEQQVKDIKLCLEESEKKLEQQVKMREELQSKTEALEKSQQEIVELQSKEASLKKENQELEDKKDKLKRTKKEKEEQLRLIKQEIQEEQSSDNRLKNKFNLLDGIQEWSLEEWDETHAKFTFFKETVELLVLFGPLAPGAGTKNSWDQKVERIELNCGVPEQVNSYQRKVHTLLKQSVSQELLTEMCTTKAGLAKVLEHVSWFIYRAKAVGMEVYKIGLPHITSFRENGLEVEFSSSKAFVKFVLHIQLDLQLYPEGVTFNVTPLIGRYSQTEIETRLNAVKAGPCYLTRLVETADQLIGKQNPVPPQILEMLTFMSDAN